MEVKDRETKFWIAPSDQDYHENKDFLEKKANSSLNLEETLNMIWYFHKRIADIPKQKVVESMIVFLVNWAVTKIVKRMSIVFSLIIFLEKWILVFSSFILT